MIKFKTLLVSTLLLTSTTFIQSCSNDDDTVYYTEMGTVTSLQNGDNSYVNVDGDSYGTSSIINGAALKTLKADSIGQRILYSYTVEEGNSSRVSEIANKRIKLVDLQKVLTKKMDIFDQQTQTDGYGNDAISPIGVYVSKSHLNIQFVFRGLSPNIAHRISLVARKGATPDADGTLNVEFRHNSFNDIPNERKLGYVSYTLESIPGYSEGKLKKLIINYNSFESENAKVEVNFTNKEKSSAAMSSNNIPVLADIF